MRIDLRKLKERNTNIKITEFPDQEQQISYRETESVRKGFQNSFRNPGFPG